MSWLERCRPWPLAAVAWLAACDTPTPPVVVEEVLSELSAVTAGDGFVAVGTEALVRDGFFVPGSERVIIAGSADGQTWDWLDVSQTGFLLDVAHGGGTYVAVGSRPSAGGSRIGLLLHSDDGVTWTALTESSVFSWASVTYGDGQFAATGFQPGSGWVVVASPNGRDWEEVAFTQLLSARVHYALGAFRVTGESGTIFSSVDLDEWATQHFTELNRIDGVSDVDGRLVASGVFDCCFGEVPTAIEYYTLASDEAGAIQVHERELRRALGRYVGGPAGVIGLDLNALFRSADLLSWETAFTPTDPQAYMIDIVHAHGRYVVVGRKDVLTSLDGVTWTAVPMPAEVTQR